MSHLRLIAAAIVVFALLLVVPVAGLILLGLFLLAALVSWLFDGTDERPCPRCGRKVPVGELECGSCGFDFRTIGTQSS